MFVGEFMIGVIVFEIWDVSYEMDLCLIRFVFVILVFVLYGFFVCF